MFAEAAKYVAEGRGQAPSTGWLYVVARRRLVDEIRARSREPTWLPLEDRNTAARDGPEARDSFMLVIEAIATLPPAQRQIVGLRCFMGLSFADIAAELETSEAASKMRFERARKALSRRLTLGDATLLAGVIIPEAATNGAFTAMCCW